MKHKIFCNAKQATVSQLLQVREQTNELKCKARSLRFIVALNTKGKNAYKAEIGAGNSQPGKQNQPVDV